MILSINVFDSNKNPYFHPLVLLCEWMLLIRNKLQRIFLLYLTLIYCLDHKALFECKTETCRDTSVFPRFPGKQVLVKRNLFIIAKWVAFVRKHFYIDDTVLPFWRYFIKYCSSDKLIQFLLKNIVSVYSSGICLVRMSSLIRSQRRVVKTHQRLWTKCHWEWFGNDSPFFLSIISCVLRIFYLSY